MKKIIYLTSLFILSMRLAFSHESVSWNGHWCNGLQFYEDSDFCSADRELTRSIQIIEKEQLDIPYVYISRAKLYHKTDQYEKALPDLEKALNSKEIKKVDRVEALMRKIGCCLNLRLFKEALIAEQEVTSIAYDAPIFEHYGKNIVIRNVPEHCECFEEMINIAYIETGVWKKENITKLKNSNVWIIKTDQCYHTCRNNSDRDKEKEWSLEEQVSFLKNDIIFDDYGVRLRELDD